MATRDAPSDDVQIVEIASCPHVGARLARWHVSAFGHLYPAWDEATAEAEFATMTAPGRIPTTWVAFAGSERSEDDVLGSVSLIADDELDGFRDEGPWLASLFVAPLARGRGLGERLVATCLAAAAGLGVERVLLFTDDHEDYYTRRGWAVVARTSANGVDVAVMAIDPRTAAQWER